MTNIELIKVKAKIRALSQKTTDNGATEAEALAAMKKIGELLELYNLNLTETFLAETTCILGEVPYYQKNRPGWSSIFMSIAAFTQTRCWNAVGQGLIKFFGMPEDVELAVYLGNTVVSAIATEARRFKSSPTYQLAPNRRRATSSFKLGLVSRLDERLVRPAAAKMPTTGTDLVVLKKAKVEDEFQKLGMRLRRTKSHSRVTHSGAYSAGKEAGDRVNINRPLTQNSSSVLMLT